MTYLRRVCKQAVTELLWWPDNCRCCVRNTFITRTTMRVSMSVICVYNIYIYADKISSGPKWPSSNIYYTRIAHRATGRYRIISCRGGAKRERKKPYTLVYVRMYRIVYVIWNLCARGKRAGRRDARNVTLLVVKKIIIPKKNLCTHYANVVFPVALQ